VKKAWRLSVRGRPKLRDMEFGKLSDRHRGDARQCFDSIVPPRQLVVLVLLKHRRKVLYAERWQTSLGQTRSKRIQRLLRRRPRKANPCNPTTTHDGINDPMLKGDIDDMGDRPIDTRQQRTEKFYTSALPPFDRAAEFMLGASPCVLPAGKEPP
jgi:hypothetical protein